MRGFSAAFARRLGFGFLEFDAEGLSLFGDDLDVLLVFVKAVFGGGEDVFSGRKLDFLRCKFAEEIWCGDRGSGGGRRVGLNGDICAFGFAQDLDGSELFGGRRCCGVFGGRDGILSGLWGSAGSIELLEGVLDFLSDFFAEIGEGQKRALGFVSGRFDANVVLTTHHELEGQRGGLWHFFVVDPEGCSRGDAGYLDGAANNGGGW